MAYNAKLALKYLTPDKCRPPCDMGMSIQFADPMPGVSDTEVRPYGWSEYESAYRHQYLPDPNVKKKICRDPCKPRGTARKAPPRQFFDPCCSVPRNNICSLCRMAKCQCKIPPPWKECKEKVVVYDPDSVRDLIVHGELKNEHPIVLSNCDYNKILNKALVKTKEERQAECIAGIEAKQREVERCRQLADEMRMMDKVNFNATISPEAKEAEEEVLSRANTIIVEDEPEIRTINKVILAAKVQAIREAQLAEKELIKCEQAQEEQRLLAMVSNTDNPLLKDEAKEYEEQEKKKSTLRNSLMSQLNEREAMKYLEKTALEHERGEMKKVWEMQDIEEAVLKNAALEKKAKLGKELLEDQLDQLEKKKMLKAWDRQEDEQMLEWMAKKDAEAKRAEREEAEKKRLRELALREVFSTKEKQEQSKTLREELRIRRYQEQQDREWRQQERQQMMKQRRSTDELKSAILSQIRQRQEDAISQAAFEKAMYDKIYGIHKMKFDEDTVKEEDRKIKNAQHKLDLREQIHKDQLTKIQQRKDHFVEGINSRRQLSRRDKEIRNALECKLEELKAANLPDKYICYVRKAVEEELKPEWQKSITKHN